MAEPPTQPTRHHPFQGKPGDEAPPGTPGSGEAICPDCGGGGRRDARECDTCDGTGIITGAIGGA